MSKIVRNITIDIGSDLDWGFDLTDWLASGETVSSATWTLVTSGTGLTLHDDAISDDSLSVVVWINAANAVENSGSAPYQVEVAFTTSASRKESASFLIQVIT